jgi:pSer/pThr/pTyr-binding forkhead associated (FHA) protein
MVPAYLLSLLKHQQEALKDRFAERFPHQWLVWEAGTWTAADGAKETIHSGPQRDLQAAPRRADALSFGLRVNGSGGQITIGRNAGNDIVINDATVSRHHAVLRNLPQAGWALEALPGVRAATRVAHLDVKAGTQALLRNGMQVKLGDAVLTFYDMAGLMERLRA